VARLVAAHGRTTLAWLADALVQAGCHLTSLQVQRPTFEDALVRLVEGAKS
jgi:hypothetical protein